MALLAVGAGVAFGLDAAFLKTGSTLGHAWRAWLGLAGSFALAGIGNVLIQRAFQVTRLTSSFGPLPPSRPIASLLFGVLLSRERFFRSELAATGARSGSWCCYRGSGVDRLA